MSVFGDEYINISLFGSSARGGRDANSDLDILAVVEDGSGKQDESKLSDLVFELFGMKPSISWYGTQKMQRFFRNGDLFAWHLYLEAKPIFGFEPLENFYGQPREYRDAVQSIDELMNVFDSIPVSLETCPQSEKFEFGVAYVCLRNAAMAASWHLCQSPDFGRLSPYSIVNPGFPIQRDAYDKLALCRLAGQRGIKPPDTSSIDAVQLLEAGESWMRNLRKEVVDVE